MKKFFSVVVLLVSLTINAQENPLQWSVIAGMNVAKMGSLDSKVGFHTGVKSELSLPTLADGVYANVAVLLSLKGSSVDYGDFGDAKCNAYYLEVPIHLGYKYAVNDNFSVFGEAGPYIAYGLFGKTKGTSPMDYDEDTAIKYDTFDEYKRFDIGAGLKVGVELKKKYTLSLGYDWGFINTYKGLGEDEDVDLDLTPTMKNKNLTISLGYKF